ncbi:hypothetical protein [Bacillus phage SDFMU_Pbc]|uniref:Uncharacterized protein n=1 Tax=Bacillus phage SDFMU_Pbc TaxID=3076135 RepID=A0AA96KRR4_9CAUD|nr:hypothetical protein [Bacillus phage SDFMU_Pbc]
MSLFRMGDIVAILTGGEKGLYEVTESLDNSDTCKVTKDFADSELTVLKHDLFLVCEVDDRVDV